MVAVVPSLERTLYLKDPQSIIAYTLRRYHTTPGNTIPFLSNFIISLPKRVAQFGNNPDQLCRIMEEDLNGVFTRIFAGDRSVTVSVSYVEISGTHFDITTSVIYSVKTGDLDRYDSTVGLVDGKLTIPEDVITFPPE